MQGDQGAPLVDKEGNQIGIYMGVEMKHPDTSWECGTGIDAFWKAYLFGEDDNNDIRIY